MPYNALRVMTNSVTWVEEAMDWGIVIKARPPASSASGG